MFGEIIEITQSTMIAWGVVVVMALLAGWVVRGARIRSQLLQYRQDTKYHLMNGDNKAIVDDLELLLNQYGWVNPNQHPSEQ